MGSFYFLRIFSVLPRPVSPLVNPPRGVYPQAPKTPPQARETVNPYKHTPTHKSPGKRPTTPHNASRTQRHEQPNNPRRRTQRTPDTMHPRPRTTQARDTFASVQGLPRSPRAAILDYILRLPGGGTRTKKPRHITGAVKSFIHF